MKIKAYVLTAILSVMLAAVIGLKLWMVRGHTSRAAAIADMLGVRRSDEMERMIQYQAVSIAYWVMLVSLLLITFYEVYIKKSSIPLSNLALLLGVLTQSFAALVLRYKSTKGDDEYRPFPLWKTLLIVLGLAAAVGILGGLLCISLLAA